MVPVKRTEQSEGKTPCAESKSIDAALTVAAAACGAKAVDGHVCCTRSARDAADEKRSRAARSMSMY
jgi:hypothetical protein